jgi:hypothetical protein
MDRVTFEDGRFIELPEDFQWGDWNTVKFVALYKTFSGDEFIEASLSSIYQYMYKIVFVNSEVSWSGERGNTVRAAVQEWKDQHDHENKIIMLDGEWTSQDFQYNYGYDWIKKNLPETQYVMLIDTDELWEAQELHRAMWLAFLDKENEAWSIRLHTYIKSIFYKITPPEWCKPTVFIKTTQKEIKGPRGINCSPKRHLDDVFMHHFTYVRATEELVMNKIVTSFIGDGPGTKCVPFNDWVENKWKKLPFATNFHTTQTAETSWQGIKRMFLTDLPIGVWNSPKITSIFMPFGMLLPEEGRALYDYSQGLDLAVELGTFLGRGAVLLSLGARKVVTVDLFEKIMDLSIDCYYHTLPPTYPDYTYEKVKAKLRWYSNIEVRQNETWKEADSFQDSSVDLILIDADHSFEGVERDYDFWLPKIKPNGYIIFHDYGYEGWEGVKRFVDSIKPGQIREVGVVGTMKIFKKGAA